jgi:hypothetical protein
LVILALRSGSSDLSPTVWTVAAFSLASFWVLCSIVVWGEIVKRVRRRHEWKYRIVAELLDREYIGWLTRNDDEPDATDLAIAVAAVQQSVPGALGRSLR